MKKNMEKLAGASRVSKKEQKAVSGGWSYYGICYETGETFATFAACRKSGRCPAGGCGLECSGC
jgi:hypothetical protein